MEARLVEFARLLRQNGVRVSPGGGRPTPGARRRLVGVGESAPLPRRAARHAREACRRRAGLRPALRALLLGPGRVLDGLERGLLAALEARGASKATTCARPRSPLARAHRPGSRRSAARRRSPAIAARWRASCEAAARAVDFSALDQRSTQLGFYARRLLGRGGRGRRRRASCGPRASPARARARPARRWSCVSARLRAALEALEDAARRYAELEQRARAEAPARGAASRRRASPRCRRYERRARWRRRCGAWRSGCETRLAARERARRGALHVRRTLRRNLALGGFPGPPRLPPPPPRAAGRGGPLRRVRLGPPRLPAHAPLPLHAAVALHARAELRLRLRPRARSPRRFRGSATSGAPPTWPPPGEVVSLSGNSNYGRALGRFHARFRGGRDAPDARSSSSATAATTTTRRSLGPRRAPPARAARASGSARRSAGPGGRATARCRSTRRRWTASRS